MRVIAIAKGYDNVATREIGEEFDMPEGASGTWFESAEDQAEKPRRGRPPKSEDSGRPTTVGELAKDQAEKV